MRPASEDGAPFGVDIGAKYHVAAHLNARRWFADKTHMKHLRTLVPVSLLLLLVAPATAHADLTAFWGVNRAEGHSRSTRGFSAGINLIVFGFEFEYANSSEDIAAGSPSLTTGMLNGLVQTPTSGVQFYLTAGGGFFRDRLDGEGETNVGTNIGGGAKIRLAGPLRLRLDYRVFALRGDAHAANPQRFYAGANFSF
jgi:opacity protein-like surface antigen